MLACDLDGTLLNSFSDLAESNIFYIKKAVENGVKVILCSGRSPASLKRFEELFGLTKAGCYGIGLNGSVVYKCDTREIINEVWFEDGVAEKIIGSLRKFEVDLLAYHGCDLYVEQITPVISNYAKKSGINVNMVDNLEKVDVRLSKVLVKGDFEVLSSACKYMEDRLYDNANMFFTGETMLEFTDIKATKGNALIYVAGLLDIDIKDVIAVGDNENDISMLKSAGLGIAVQNAKDKIKQYADYVTEKTCIEGVLEEIVEKFVF
ncbi:MAG: Cof-type HAD-IIB family hydrolase [Defluviitaleaceae bacterium]|nr:Cof-type HAD-IIB family hydrolase [Defluviitaleaceae bacterium]